MEAVQGIRVMLVDDSAIIRRLLGRVLDQDPEITVAGQAANGRLALTAVGTIDPDIVVLDIEMPEMDGLEALVHLKRQRPDMPVIMFSTLTERGASSTLEALTRGADDYVTKPSNTGSFEKTAEQINAALVPKIKALVERARSRPSRRGARPADPSPAAAMTPPRTRPPAAPAVPRLSTPRRVGLFRPRVVAIAVSTGGPDALNRIIPQLPADLPVPVLVTQHMPPIFTRLLAERLDAISAVQVAEATAGTRPGPGQVWFAPGGLHLLLRSGGRGPVLDLDDGEPVQSCKPAADPMFASCVQVHGGDVLGVVLTGMGADGHHGAELVRDAGGSVVCQDEETSVVWGMPGTVARAGLAEKILPVDEIASTITQMTRLSGRVDTADPLTPARS